MKFIYCTVCDHYHIDDSILPCHMLGRASKRAVLMADPQIVESMRRSSQSMLNSRKVFLQTLSSREL
jgi:hypothetical protein